MKALSLMIILAAGLHCNSSYAQVALEPCEKLEFLAGYYTGVDRIIDRAVGQSSQLQLTTLPAFQAESGVRLLATEVYFVQFKSSYWGEANNFDEGGHMDFAKPQISTSVSHAPLSPAIARSVERIYARAIASAKKSDRMGADGVSYLFSTPKAGCGEAWSPEPNSPNDHLVRLLELLEKHASLSKPSHLKRNEESIIRLLQTIEGH